MTTKYSQVNTIFTDISLPHVSIEPMLNSGSLWLFDPTHPDVQWPTVDYSGYNNFPNVALNNAKILTNTTITSDLNLTDNRANMDTGRGLVERTLRGGIHGIVSNATFPIPAYQFMRANTALRNYLNTYKDSHKFYFSLWHYITRTTANTQLRAIYSLVGQQNDGNSRILHAMEAHQILPPNTDPAYLGLNTTNLDSVGPSLRAVGVQHSSNTPIDLNETIIHNVGRSLTYTQNPTSAASQYTPSSIFYRSYCEDLTISGRTYAQAYAMDLALYNKEVLSPGGRYYADTFTNPSAVSAV